MVNENSKTPSIAVFGDLYSAHAITVCCSDGVQEFRSWQPCKLYLLVKSLSPKGGREILAHANKQPEGCSTTQGL